MRRLTMSLSIGRTLSHAVAGSGVEAAADRLDDERLGLARTRPSPRGSSLEDPAREDLLDRAVEGHRREARRDACP